MLGTAGGRNSPSTFLYISYHGVRYPWYLVGSLTVAGTSTPWVVFDKEPRHMLAKMEHTSMCSTISVVYQVLVPGTIQCTWYQVPVPTTCRYQVPVPSTVPYVFLSPTTKIISWYQGTRYLVLRLRGTEHLVPGS